MSIFQKFAKDVEVLKTEMVGSIANVPRNRSTHCAWMKACFFMKLALLELMQAESFINPGKSIQDLLEEAIEAKEAGVCLQTFTELFGNDMGTKLYHICRLGKDYPDLKLIELCQQSTAFLTKLDWPRLQMIDKKSKLKKYIAEVADDLIEP